MNKITKEMYSIIDANLDRAREGLRVIEDVARFILVDSKLTRELKELRHSIILIIEKLPIDTNKFILSREVDVGAKTYTKSEAKRKNCEAIVKACFVRIEEALRVLEEFSKLLDEKVGKEFKQLRFKVYMLEKRMIEGLENKFIQKLPPNELYVIIDRKFTRGKSCIKVAEEAINGGAKIIQLREKEMSTKELVNVAKNLRKLTKKANVLFIVNDRIDVALAIGADGVHLGKDDMPIKVARELLDNKFIGFSAHNLKQALKAEKEGANYISLGPTFFTTSKENLPKPIGLKSISEVKKVVNIPVVAIGGINQDNVDKVIKAGADCVAVISAVVSADNIKLATKTLREKIKRAKR